MGGIATSINYKESMHALKVKEGENDKEYLITRHGQFVTPINIINIYGEQESRSNKDDILDRWNSIVNEVIKIEAKKEFLVIFGDMNKHVGDLIEGNSCKISYGGQLIRDFLKSEKYHLVNSSKKVVGGPFTRYDPSDPTSNQKKSCLSLVIVSKELVKFIDKLMIDKKLKMTPSRPINKTKMIYPDHYSLVLTFKNLPLKTGQVNTGPKFNLWNTNKQGGWEKYKSMTTNNDILEKVAVDDSEDPDKMMKNIEKELNKVKYASFGKVKIRNKPKNLKALEELQNEKIHCYENEKSTSARDIKIKEIDEKMAGNLLTEQRKNFEEELKSLKDIRRTKGKSAMVFNLKSKVVGNKKVKQEATTLIDPKTKKEVNTPEEIKRVSLDYCEELLTNRKPKDDFKEDLEFKQIVHRVRMEEKVDNDIEFSEHLFQKSLKILSKKCGNKYNFIIKSGPSLKSALFKLFKVVWEKEKKPDLWRNTILIQLFKGRGSRTDMNNMRNLHTKQDIPKFFGHIVASAAKPHLNENMSPYQIGTKPGHRAQEHLFVVKSVIGFFEHNKQAVALQVWDLSKFFDRESLVDGLNELHRSNVRGKLYKLIYEMNKDTRISVRTPVGDTDMRDVGEGWGQGTIEGASCSAVNLDKGVTDFFADSEYEVSYGDVVLFPALFQDDVSRFCLDPVSAQMGNDRMEAMAETKLLDYNQEKSCFIIIGKGKERTRLEAEFLRNPPKLYGANMMKSSEEKYLGDQIHCLGLAASVAATIDKRGGKVLKSIFEIRAIIDDCRSHVAGGISSGLDIWEMAVIPFLTSNCDTWYSISDKSLQELDKLQNKFYRMLLNVPNGCPTPALYWDLGGLLMKNRILKKKLLLLHHIANLEKSSFAFQIFEVQKRLMLPGLVSECQPFLVKFEIINLEAYSKNQWKRLLNEKINDLNRSELLKQMIPYKKLDHKLLTNEKFELKPYFKQLNLSQARMKFSLRSLMVKTVKLNYPSDPKYSHDLWTCWHCPQMDSQIHILTCDGYRDLRQDKNLEQDKDLINFYQQVLKRREDSI